MEQAVYYLTPLFARIAAEQIAAWHQEQTGAPPPDRIDTRLLNTIRLEGALKAAGIDMRLLEKKGVAQKSSEKVGPCGLTDYYRDENSYVIDMQALRKLAWPAP